MKIAMISLHSSPLGELGRNDTGGMSVCTLEISRELGEAGHAVDIFTRLTGPENGMIIHLYNNVRLIYLRAGQIRAVPKSDIYTLLPDLYNTFEIFCRREGVVYDLIHSHYWLSGKVGEYAGQKWDLPHFITFHTLGAVKNIIEGVEKASDIRVTCERQLASSCHRIIASTEKEIEYLETYYDVPHQSVGLVPLGVNLDLFRPLNKPASRRKLGLNPNELHLLYVGRFVPSKGADRLLEMMSQLKDNRMYRLHIIGGEDQHTSSALMLRELAHQYNVQDRVNFLGRVAQEKLPDFYSAADLLIVPSRYESFGLVALESLACGTPVVATRVGAMEKILMKEKNGQLVGHGTPRLLAEGIETILSNSHDFSVNSIRASVTRFSWEDATSSLIREYQSAIKH